MPHILFIDNVVAFLVVNRDRYPEVATQTVEIRRDTVQAPEIPWRSSWLVVYMPVLCRMTGPGSDSEDNSGLRSCSSSDKVVDVLCVPVVQILRCRCGGDSRLPPLQLLRNPSRFCMLQYFFVVDVPVVQVHLCVQSWTRSLTCPLLSTTGYCTVEVPQIQLSPVTADIPVVQHGRG